jgi:hypothetical protein
LSGTTHVTTHTRKKQEHSGLIKIGLSVLEDSPKPDVSFTRDQRFILQVYRSDKNAGHHAAILKAFEHGNYEETDIGPAVRRLKRMVNTPGSIIEYLLKSC